MQQHFMSDQYQIIMVDEHRAGVFTVERHPTELVLKRIELLPEYQGKGIGTAIIDDLIAQAQEERLPVTLYVLNINPAYRLYERLGFRAVAEIDTGSRGVKYRMTTASEGDKEIPASEP